MGVELLPLNWGPDTAPLWGRAAKFPAKLALVPSPVLPPDMKPTKHKTLIKTNDTQKYNHRLYKQIYNNYLLIHFSYYKIYQLKTFASVHKYQILYIVLLEL